MIKWPEFKLPPINLLVMPPYKFNIKRIKPKPNKVTNHGRSVPKK